MKDGYAYNLQFRGSAPVFIDVGSFEAYRGGPWAGYRQFCQTVLFPLLLQAHRNVPFRPFLRGQVNGIEPAQMRALMAGRDLMRAGVLKHVALHSAVDARHADKGDGSRATAEKLRDSGFSDAVALAAARNTGTLVRKLRWKPGESHWTTYQQTSTYTDAEREQKVAFVASALAQQRSGLVLDLGCNDGTFSRVAQEHPTTSSRSTATSRPSRALPAAPRRGQPHDPPAGDGPDRPVAGDRWRSQERASFLDRARPDAVLALALVHHLAIGANIPLPEVVSWLRGFGGRLVVEFVEPTDPMAQRLLANKPAGLFPDYRREAFEELLAARFRVERQVTLTGGTRTLYAAVPHG